MRSGRYEYDPQGPDCGPGADLDVLYVGELPTLLGAILVAALIWTGYNLLEPRADGSGTDVTVRVRRPSSGRDRARLEAIGQLLAHAFEGGVAPLQAAIVADVATRAAAAAEAIPEPDLPVSAHRNLIAPLAAAAPGIDPTERSS